VPVYIVINDLTSRLSNQINWCIIQYESGVKNLDAVMSAKALERQYNTHMESLLNLQEVNDELVEHIQETLYVSAV
jgi:prophage DNA circulation protein